MTAVDGCGAPLLSTSLTGLAHGFRTLAVATDGPERRVAEAIRSHPAYVSGTTRDELTLLTAIPGAIGKAGAEACYAVALPDGRAFALKIDDGGARARPVVMAEALRRSGVPTEPGVDADALDDTGRVPVLGRRRAGGRDPRGVLMSGAVAFSRAARLWPCSPGGTAAGPRSCWRWARSLSLFVNNSMEGRVLYAFSGTHGLTAGDLVGLTGFLLAVVAPHFPAWTLRM